MSSLNFTPCVDSDELARENRRVLEIRFEIAESLGRSALEAIDNGEYLTDDGLVDWSAGIKAAEAAKVSIPPNAPLPVSDLRAQGNGRDETLVTLWDDTLGREVYC